MTKNYELNRKRIIQSGIEKLFRLVEYYDSSDNCYRYEVQLFSNNDKKFIVYKPFAFKSNAEGFFNHLA